jgi:hypothetical protein
MKKQDSRTSQQILDQTRASTSPVADHTYYVAAHARTYGDRIGELSAFLYATYMRHAPIEQQVRLACDGATLTTYTDGTVVVRLCINKQPFDVSERP